MLKKHCILSIPLTLNFKYLANITRLLFKGILTNNPYFYKPKDGLNTVVTQFHDSCMIRKCLKLNLKTKSNAFLLSTCIRYFFLIKMLHISFFCAKLLL